jgi:hypothetical protein
MINLEHSFVVGGGENEMQLTKRLGLVGIKVRNSQGSADYCVKNFEDVLQIINSKVEPLNK